MLCLVLDVTMVLLLLLFALCLTRYHCRCVTRWPLGFLVLVLALVLTMVMAIVVAVVDDTSGCGICTTHASGIVFDIGIAVCIRISVSGGDVVVGGGGDSSPTVATSTIQKTDTVCVRCWWRWCWC